MGKCDAEHASSRIHEQPAQCIGRRLIRAIAVCTLIFVTPLLARAVELSCALALGDSAADASRGSDMSVVGHIGETAGIVASSMVGLSGMAAAALAALALATLLLAIRARTPRIGSTLTSLALFAAIATHAPELRGSLAALSAGAFGIAVTVAVVLATVVLATRWIEDVALTVALEKSSDPLAISADMDAEARDAARCGVSSVDQASYRLAGALGRHGGTGAFAEAVIEDVGLSGKGSPIPCRMPDDGPLPVRAA